MAASLTTAAAHMLDVSNVLLNNLQNVLCSLSHPLTTYFDVWGHNTVFLLMSGSHMWPSLLILKWTHTKTALSSLFMYIRIEHQLWWQYYPIDSNVFCYAYPVE